MAFIRYRESNMIMPCKHAIMQLLEKSSRSFGQ